MILENRYKTGEEIYYLNYRDLDYSGLEYLGQFFQVVDVDVDDNKYFPLDSIVKAVGFNNDKEMILKSIIDGKEDTAAFNDKFILLGEDLKNVIILK